MGYRSYTTYDCNVPDTTKLHGDFGSTYMLDDMTLEHKDGRYELHFDCETRYCEDILEDLTELFQMPLDKVPGLELHCCYETYEDGYWKCELDIVDGKCYYKESEISMVEQPMDQCLINIGYEED